MQVFLSRDGNLIHLVRVKKLKGEEIIWGVGGNIFFNLQKIGDVIKLMEHENRCLALNG